MRTTYFIHILGASIGLLAGYLALYVSKGGALHRRAGTLFVFAMLGMCAAGLIIAIVRGVAPEVNVPAGLLTAYLVITAFTTVRPEAGARWLDVGAMVTALAVGLASLSFGAQAIAAGGSRNEIPAFPFFLFGILGVLGAAGDLRVLRTGARKGPYRLARHLWRMCFALLIAAMSFFLGPSERVPELIRGSLPLRVIPVLAVLLTMLYWVWRVRFRRSLRGLALDSTDRGRSVAKRSAATALPGVAEG